MTGPGGVGKTRLAIHVAGQIAHAFLDGCWFVPLAPIQHAELVPPAIARVIELPANPEHHVEEQLLAELREAKALLVLDNFEHLPDAAPFIARLLAQCPGLTMLVTSRAELRISGERVIVVPPLSVPDSVGQTSEALAGQDAVRLFGERAAQANADFVVTPANVETVGAICRQVDGLPLAIELAAAWTGQLPLPALLGRLTARLPLLADGPIDAPARHQTMRDSISWSYDLLTPDEQAVFRRAGIFVGGFCLEAIEAVAADAIGHIAVLGHVRALVEKSLLRPAPVGDIPRYQMLETIREFALARLAGEGELDATQCAHGAWCADFTERFGVEVVGRRQAEWRSWADAEMDNLRAALGHAEAFGDGASAVRLAGGIGWLWLYPGRLQEGLGALERALVMPGAESDPYAFARALLVAGGIEGWLQRHASSRRYFERALAVCQAPGDRHQALIAQRGIGTTLIYAGDAEEATTVLADVRQRSIESGSAWDVAYATWLVGIAAFAQGDVVSAHACQEEALAAFREMGDGEYTANCLEALGWVALCRADREAAQETFLELLDLSGAADRWSRARALRGLGAVVADQDPRRAARLLAAADAEFETAGARQRIPVEAFYTQILDRVRAALGEPAFAEAWASGSALTADEAGAEGRAVAARSVPTRGALELEFGLTRRETDVLRLVAMGLTDQEIADQLFISRRTASKHVESILAKLNVGSRRAAALVVITIA
jgi:non-specific serine/threonine protein kinase